MRKIILILVVVSIIYFLYKNQKYENNNVTKTNERYTPQNDLEDGIYFISNQSPHGEVRLLTADSDPSVYIKNIGFTNPSANDNSLDTSKWKVTKVDENLYTIINIRDGNKCMMFGNSGRDEYASRFSWSYATTEDCGIKGGKYGLLNSNRQMLWKLKNVGGNKFVIQNTSNAVLDTTTISSTINGVTTTTTQNAAMVKASDINSPMPAPISSLYTAPSPICLAITGDLYPQRFVNTKNLNNLDACGFDNYNELINDGRAVWSFTKAS
jgi:hypothetical protein